MKADPTPKILPFAHWLNGEPDRVMFTCSTAALTQADTVAAARAAAAQLQALQPQPGETAAVMTGSSYAFLCALACCSLHALSVLLPGHKNLTLLRRQAAQCRLVITDDEQAAREARDLGLAVLFLPQFPLQPRSVSAAGDGRLPLDPNLPLTLLTSGSTGQAKAVVKPIACLDKEAALLSGLLRSEISGSTVVATVYPFHMYGLTFSMFLPLACSLPVRVPIVHYSEELCARQEPKLLLITSPAFLQRLDFALRPPAVALAVSAGGPLPPELRAKFKNWCGADIIDIYGSTETGVIGFRRGQTADGAFTPLPETTLTAGAVPRLHSPLLPQGSCTLDDQLQLLPDGRFLLCGRQDRIVKIDEKRISLPAVEQYLLGTGLFCECAVLPVQLKGRRQLAAAVVLKDQIRSRQLQQHPREKLLFLQQLRRQLQEQAAAGFVPRRFALLPALPRNLMGKLDHAALEELFVPRDAVSSPRRV